MAGPSQGGSGLCSRSVWGPLLVVVVLNWAMFLMVLTNSNRGTDGVLGELHGELVHQHELEREWSASQAAQYRRLEEHLEELRHLAAAQFEGTVDVLQQVGDRIVSEGARQTRGISSAIAAIPRPQTQLQLPRDERREGEMSAEEAQRTVEEAVAQEIARRMKEWEEERERQLEREKEALRETENAFAIECKLPDVVEVIQETATCMGVRDPYFDQLQRNGIESIRSGEGKLLFLHIQKTGGTSLRKAIEEKYGKHPRTKEIGFPQPQNGYWLATNLRAPDTQAIKDYKAIYGHFSFGIHSLFPPPTEYCYVTLLREPVSRIVSLYYYIQHFYPDVKNGRSLSEFMSPFRDFQYHNKDNGMTRALCGYEAWLAPFKGVRREHLLCAKKNLRDYFSLILLTEKYDEGIQLLSHAFQWQNPKKIEVNVTPKYPSVEEHPPELIDQIRALNSLDIELYEYAQELYEEQL
eukprot:CAMPEP_0114607846 /NCGR_PEP_ID=MMETSP0168-20121206/2273_1 /TAXON_ID=95228 ORGANISM="Vannella sp., Strain DIVA3 517/6/12" /NCGR_SAMPLE_ID=MMETSP0168 /ASSEMBLY_ACC=CAM_ASM_000044 /LENGTH=465 /DNA_ID=CAMNT_0001818725 /DNA_START=31 /DNA_END=1425 /DNA_ORIENTATION=-